MASIVFLRLIYFKLPLIGGDVRDSDGGGKYIPPARRQPSVSSSSGMPMKQHVNSGKLETFIYV